MQVDREKFAQVLAREARFAAKVAATPMPPQPGAAYLEAEAGVMEALAADPATPAAERAFWAQAATERRALAIKVRRRETSQKGKRRT